MRFSFRVLTLIAFPMLLLPLQAEAQADSKERAKQAILKAVQFFHGDVAKNGGYVYFYSVDLKQRFGEGPASPTEIWVQPPGTPTVGEAFVEAWKATNDPRCLQAADDAATALIYGQLKSGGWTSSIDFNPKGRTAAYRNGKGRGKNNSTFDDDTSTAALRFLMKLDQAHEFNQPRLHAATMAGLDAMMSAQFTNGAFPQIWTGPVSQQTPRRASYPDYDWRVEGRIKNYWDMYTLNDDAATAIVETLQVAHDVYRAEKYRTAMVKFGEFLIAAQMPEPQPGWAQQYNYKMQPIWARRFEPAAVAGRESEDAIRALLMIHQVTGDDRFGKPIPAALRYLKRSVLPDGRLARYYELRTNRPLYMTRNGRNYTLTYDDSNLPSHYGWKVTSHIAELERLWRNQKRKRAAAKPVSSAQVLTIIKSLDARGRWVSRYGGERLIGQQKFTVGQSYISSEVFRDNIALLARFLRQ